MKTLIEPENQETILAHWRGAQAKIWLFHVTHNRLALNLFKKGAEEAIYIVDVGCKRLTGPFGWNEADMTIVTEQPDQWGETCCRIIDKRVGFELACSDVTIIRGPAEVPDDPFDGFLV